MSDLHPVNGIAKALMSSDLWHQRERLAFVSLHNRAHPTLQAVQACPLRGLARGSEWQKRDHPILQRKEW